MERINIAELLKDCPTGMELDCTMYDNFYFNQIYDDCCLYRIGCYTIVDGIRTHINFTETGTFNAHVNAKCVIFPKGKATWEGFRPPCKFKDGDIVFYDNTIAIFKEWGDETLFRTYVTNYLCCDSLIDINVPLFGKSVRKEIRLATEEEKQKLFQAIKDNGYRWDEETKTLVKLIEKPKFKVGDRIRHIVGREEFATVVSVEELHYNLDSKVGTSSFSISLQHEWELVPDKFDINTLTPFESRVLVRNSKDQYWIPAFWGFRAKDGYVTTFGHCNYCIPYEGNEHLRGKTDDCDNFYKAWE